MTNAEFWIVFRFSHISLLTGGSRFFPICLIWNWPFSKVFSKSHLSPCSGFLPVHSEIRLLRKNFTFLIKREVPVQRFLNQNILLKRNLIPDASTSDLLLLTRGGGQIFDFRPSEWNPVHQALRPKTQNSKPSHLFQTPTKFHFFTLGEVFCSHNKKWPSKTTSKQFCLPFFIFPLENLSTRAMCFCCAAHIRTEYKKKKQLEIFWPQHKILICHSWHDFLFQGKGEMDTYWLVSHTAIKPTKEKLSFNFATTPSPVFDSLYTWRRGNKHRDKEPAGIFPSKLQPVVPNIVSAWSASLPGDEYAYHIPHLLRNLRTPR